MKSINVFSIALEVFKHHFCQLEMRPFFNVK